MNGEFNYEEKLVAFIDILGFKLLVNEGLKKAKILDDIINNVLKNISENDKHGFSAKLFSDCLCLSCKYSITGINIMLFNLAYIQIYFSMSNVFLRGAVSKDYHFENERIIFSKGLIKAYSLEQEAVYPRIIIDDKIIDFMKNNSTNNSDKDYFQYVMKAPDGKYFIDYLDFLWSDTMDKEEFMKSHKEAILRQVNKNISDNKIIDKYKWLSDYHNFEFFGFFSPKNTEETKYNELHNNLVIPVYLAFPSFNKFF